MECPTCHVKSSRYICPVTSLSMSAYLRFANICTSKVKCKGRMASSPIHLHHHISRMPHHSHALSPSFSVSHVPLNRAATTQRNPWKTLRRGLENGKSKQFLSRRREERQKVCVVTGVRAKDCHGIAVALPCNDVLRGRDDM